MRNHPYSKIIFLPVLALGVWGAAFSARAQVASTLYLHPTRTTGNTNWQYGNGGSPCTSAQLWSCVNDAAGDAPTSSSQPSSDYEATEIRSADGVQTGEIIFGSANGIVPAGSTNISIQLIYVTAKASSDDPNGTKFRPFYRVPGGGKVYVQTSAVGVGAWYADTSSNFFGFQPLTESQVNQLEIGVDLIPGSAQKQIFISRMMARINYTTPAPQPNDASFVSQTAPPSAIAAGQTANVSVMMQNTGTNTWTSGGNYRLGSQNPQDNMNWGMNRVNLGGSDSIAPGQQKTFNFTVTAPSAPGTYNFQWRMVQDGVAWFGGLSTNVAVNVIAPPAVTTNAASGITPTSATLNGSANPNGGATTGWFRYSATNPGSCTDSFGSRVPASGGAALGSGFSPAAYSNSASGLTGGTTYYYCAIASNGGGTRFGSIVSFFVPLPAAPTVSLTADPATVVSGYSTTLTWTSSGADSCSASANPSNGQWTGAKALNGSQIITNMAVSTVFTITCTNIGGSTPGSATVTVTPPPNVSGHAWAGSGENDGTNSNPGIGWLKMSGIAGDGRPYGVLVSSASPGVLSGYAWANPNDVSAGTNNIGWISFNEAELGGCPSGTCRAELSRTTGAVTGWARACSVFAAGCSGALKSDNERGGWDGWIRLWRDSDGDGVVNTDTGAAVSDYGISVSDCAWSGYAWGGGMNIGWIHFGAALYPTTGSGDACVTIATVPNGPSGLAADAGNTLATCNAMAISWSDNATNEDRFELERKLSSMPDATYVEIAEPAANSVSFTDAGAVGGLARNTSYTYRIRACNAFGCGAYSNTDAANNQNPLPSFTWTPPSPLKNANTSFNASASTVYGGTSITEYYWTFADGIPAVFCSSVAGSGCNLPPLTPLASTRFQFPPAPAQKSVMLRVTDSASRQCSVTQPVTVRSGSVSPKWLEVAPE